MSDWVAVMRAGRVVQWGTPWEVYYRPRTPFMADFVGSVNLVRAAVIATQGDRVRVRVGDRELDLPARDGALPSGGDVLLSIRPESLRLAAADPPVAHEGVAFAGQVVRHTFLGHLMRYAVRAGDQEWLVDQPDPGASAPLDGAVTVLVNPERIHLIPAQDPGPAASSR
jgi:ABC-type Fe3+/spermidine/putrescine transport system ATPase subunit